MAPKFAPNSPDAKFLFTGRSTELGTIINHVLMGRCVGLFGERRSGKTLTLQTLEGIINGSIENYKDRMVDQTLLSALPTWQQLLTNHQAIYVTLHATRDESDLLNEFTNQLQKIGLIRPPSVLVTTDTQDTARTHKRLGDLLLFLQAELSAKERTLVVLMDEMEVLEAYRDGGPVAEYFNDREKYTRIVYVHAGSYQWLERVYSPGSLFTHLEPLYLKSINENDMRNYLLRPLADDTEKTFVVDMTGGKPLYAHYVGIAVDEKGVSIDNLLKDNAYLSLRQQVERNIFQEKGLDDDSKKIMALLAHHPDATCKWASKKLKLNETNVSNKLNKLVEFGTVVRSDPSYKFTDRLKGKYGRETYKIVGGFIESYGRRICDDPCQKAFGRPPVSLSEKLLPPLRWVAMLVAILVATGVYFYTHPSKVNRLFQHSNTQVRIDIPVSLENEEADDLKISVTNDGATPVEPLTLVFDSPHIRYNKNGVNAITFPKIEPHRTAYESIAYYVLPGTDSILSSTVSIPEQATFSFESTRRKLSLKQYSLYIAGIITILGLIIPGKNWATVIGVIQKFLLGSSGSNDQPKSSNDKD